MNKDNTVILSCGSLITHVKAAQKRMGTDFKVIPLDRRLHSDPMKMQERIIRTMAELPDNIENVLVSMGFCGGSWRDVPIKHRVVIPRVDDCITLLLHKDQEQHSNLKKEHHLYFRDGDDKSNSFGAMKEPLCRKYGKEQGEKIFKAWFESYTHLDILDTGVYDCRSKSYVEAAERNAEAIGCRLSYAQGSNILLEKLVSGNWDQQFYVGEPNTCTTGLDYLDSFHNAHNQKESPAL